MGWVIFSIQGWLVMLAASLAVFTSAHAAECKELKDLPGLVATEFMRDVKKIRLEITPVELGAKPAYVISDLDSCNVFNGNCDAQIYLAFEKNCYDPVLSFRGKWQGMQNGARELASAELWVESNSKTRSFKFDSGKKRFVERER